MLLDDVQVEDVRTDLALGRLTGGAVANVLKAAQAEAEEILDSGRAGIAGPGIGYVRSHPNRVREWLANGRRFRVWTVDEAEDVEHCLAVGIQEITTNRPADVLRQVGSAVV